MWSDPAIRFRFDPCDHMWPWAPVSSMGRLERSHSFRRWSGRTLSEKFRATAWATRRLQWRMPSRWLRDDVDPGRLGQAVAIRERLRRDAHRLGKFLRLHPVEIRAHERPWLRIELRVVHRDGEPYVVLIDS